MREHAPASSPPESPRAKSLPLHLPLADTSEVVPARMINEVLYCERLMYLEWVQGEWADNFFTVDGTAVHKRADKPGKPLKPARLRKASELEGKGEEGEEKPLTEEERPYEARAVWLTSEALGITAKIDVVDVDGGRVVPIEYKRGKRPACAEGAWLPERAQLCAQVLVLRDQGYQCEEAAIYYAGDKQRVAIPITESLIQTVLGAVARARQLVAQGQIPPPLDDSPKCKGCSLVGICLPDETNLLAKSMLDKMLEESAASLELTADADPWGLLGGTSGVVEPEPVVRRLYPARDDRLPLYVQHQGATIGLSGERLVVRGRSGPTEARLRNTSQVSVFGNVQLSTQAIRALLTRDIPTFFFSTGGWFVGRALSHDTKNVELRLAQYRFTQDPAFCLKLASVLTASKITNCRTLLRRNHSSPSAVALSELKQLARKAKEAPALESLLGIEGSAARVYFAEFGGMLKGEGSSAFDLDGRNRRPPRDPVNALLSLAYSLLAKELTNSLATVGLDPLLGFYHQPRFGRPGLALDLMEEFRPLLADSSVITAINNGVVTESDFIRSADAVALKPAARRRFILSFERRLDQLVTHPVFDYRVSYRRVLELQCRLLSRLLLGEIPEYPTFNTR